MSLVTLRLDGSTKAGRVDGETIVILDASSVRGLLEQPSLLGAETGRTVPLADAEFAPVVPDPQKIVCVGVNYQDHILEMGREAPSSPTYFAKFQRALTGAFDDLLLPPAEVSTMIDWEGELAVIVGSTARNVSPDQALEVIAGYTILNDVSARDWQRRTTQFLAGKTFEGLTPLGPRLVSVDELGDGGGLKIMTKVNGEVKQQSNTSNLVFGVADIIADLSRIMTLDPGDVVSTGTPGGVGAARNPPEFLTSGDVVEVSIEGIGSLLNHCRAA